MFGPRKNDHFLQDRSKENRVYIIFVHPCEFLVTAPDGAILTNALLGEKLFLSPAELGTQVDSKRVFSFDLPIKAE